MPNDQHEFTGLEAADGRTVVGRRLLWRRTVPSTMDEARRAGLDGEPEGLVVLADAQTAGRGRMDRSWVSPPGRDLLLSVLFRPPPAAAPQLPMLAGLAVAQTLDALAIRRPALKWPNDVRIGGKKIAGVLSEMEHGPAGSFAVVGIGLNVNMDPAAAPEIAGIATSLRAVNGRDAVRRDVLLLLLQELDSLYARVRAGESLVGPWSERLETLGRQVVVKWGGETVRGLAEGVDEQGRLLVRDHTGRLRELPAGEVTFQARPESPSPSGSDVLSPSKRGSRSLS